MDSPVPPARSLTPSATEKQRRECAPHARRRRHFYAVKRGPEGFTVSEPQTGWQRENRPGTAHPTLEADGGASDVAEPIRWRSAPQLRQQGDSPPGPATGPSRPSGLRVGSYKH